LKGHRGKIIRIGVLQSVVKNITGKLTLKTCVNANNAAYIFPFFLIIKQAIKTTKKD
jgi:hypothetical protein